VYAIAVVLLQVEVEQGDARDRGRDADRVLRLEVGQERARRLDVRHGVVAVSLGEADGAHRQARVEAAQYQLRRPAAEVDEERLDAELSDSTAGEPGLLVAG